MRGLKLSPPVFNWRVPFFYLFVCSKREKKAMGGLKLTPVFAWRVPFFLFVCVFEKRKKAMGGVEALTAVFNWRVSKHSEAQRAVEQQHSLGAFCRLERLQEIAPSALAEGAPP